jgi:hypothetical protein
MLAVRYGITALAAVLTVSVLSTAAGATYRGCGFDRYGYHPPDFRGCYYGPEIVEVPVPVVRVKPVRRAQHVHRVPRAPLVRRAAAIAPPPPPPPPFEGYYAAAPIQPGCYFDNGYDMRVHRICYSGW